MSNVLAASLDDDSSGTPRTTSPSISVMTATPPVQPAPPTLVVLRTGVCRTARRELDAARERRIAETKEGDAFGPSPRHPVHFDGKWLCTGCGFPIVHHFDCIRSQQELDHDRARRIAQRSTSFMASSIADDEEDDLRLGTSKPSSWKPPKQSVSPHRSLDRLRGNGIPPLGQWATKPPLAGTLSSNAALEESNNGVGNSTSATNGERGGDGSGSSPDSVYPPDPNYLVHVENGNWVCSLPGCRHPIDVHRSIVNECKRDLLFHPPPDSRLSVLAQYVGRVSSVSPRQIAKSQSRPATPGPTGSPSMTFAPSPAPMAPALAARHRMGLYAETCCVCGYPDRRPFPGYPAHKVTKQGLTVQPTVTMAHILAPDALEKVCYADDDSNYLPLCGTLGWEGTCHDAFDKNLILFAYEGAPVNDGHFMIWASDPVYKHLSGRHVVFPNRPHRSALHARARQALTSAQVVETPELVSEAVVRSWHPEPPAPDDRPSTPPPATDDRSPTPIYDLES